NLDKAIKGTKFIGIFTGIFALKDAAQCFSDVFTKEKKSEKAAAFGWGLFNLADATGSAADVADGLRVVGAVSAEAVEWTSTVGIVLLPLQAVLLGMQVKKTWKEGSLLMQFRNAEKQNPGNPVFAALDMVSKKGDATIAREFSLGKRHQIEKRV